MKTRLLKIQELAKKQRKRLFSFSIIYEASQQRIRNQSLMIESRNFQKEFLSFKKSLEQGHY